MAARSRTGANMRFFEFDNSKYKSMNVWSKILGTPPSHGAPLPRSATQTPTRLVMPVDAPVTQPFGKVSSRGSHPGADLGSPSGTPLRAPISGQVVQAVMGSSACGGTIAIQNGNVRHRFCHCRQINVKPGDQVRQGQVVGQTGGGRTDPGAGLSTGPHLHWEKYVAGQLVNPLAE